MSLTKQDLADIRKLITDAIKPVETRLGSVETRLGNLEAGVKAIRDHFGIDDERWRTSPRRGQRVSGVRASRPATAKACRAPPDQVDNTC